MVRRGTVQQGPSGAPVDGHDAPSRSSRRRTSLTTLPEPAAAAPPPAPLAGPDAAPPAKKNKGSRPKGKKLGVQPQPEMLEQPGLRLRERSASGVVTRVEPFSSDEPYFRNTGWHGEAAIAREALSQQVCIVSIEQ